MQKFVMIGTANAKPGREEEFNTWYETIHMKEVLAIPGVKSARRLEAVANAASVAPARFVTIYELETEHPDEVVRELHRRGAAGEMRHTASIDPEGSNIFFYRPL